MGDSYRLIYTSRSTTSRDAGEPRQEVLRILTSSRRNNERYGLTGVLLAGAGTFAQVLEGPRARVEATFERIQCDIRHDAINVLACEPVAARSFPDWSMALVEPSGRASALLDGLSRRGSHTLASGEGDALCATLLALMRADQGGAGGPPNAEAVRVLDAEKLRAELDARAPVAHATAKPAELKPVPPVSPAEAIASADMQASVLRQMLDEERDRTTALRRELDDARVALAQARAAVETVERHRDIWADRGRQLRSSLKDVRDALGSAQLQADGLRRQLASGAAEHDRLRAHRDIWAERARSLAMALCREPAVPGEDASAPQAGTDHDPAKRPPLSVVAS